MLLQERLPCRSIVPHTYLPPMGGCSSCATRIGKRYGPALLMPLVLTGASLQRLQQQTSSRPGGWTHPRGLIAPSTTVEVSVVLCCFFLFGWLLRYLSCFPCSGTLAVLHLSLGSVHFSARVRHWTYGVLSSIRERVELCPREGDVSGGRRNV